MKETGNGFMSPLNLWILISIFFLSWSHLIANRFFSPYFYGNQISCYCQYWENSIQLFTHIDMIQAAMWSMFASATLSYVMTLINAVASKEVKNRGDPGDSLIPICLPYNLVGPFCWKCSPKKSHCMQCAFHGVIIASNFIPLSCS